MRARPRRMFFGAMATERTLPCPSCKHEIRVTTEELADKRGFCALCGTRFDITIDMIDGASPFRAAETVALVPASPPPSVRIERAAGRVTIRLRTSPPRAKTVGLVALSGLMLVLVFWGRFPIVALFWLLLVAGMALWAYHVLFRPHII